MKKSKNVSVSYITVTSLDTHDLLSFDEMLRSVKAREFPSVLIKRSIRILDDTKGIIIGYVKTVSKDNLPPAIQKDGTEGILLSNEQDGVGFANVFLYDHNKKCLLYEINSNGCRLDKFLDLISNAFNYDESSAYSISESVVFEKEEYERILNMSEYCKVVMKMTIPSIVSQDHHQITSGLLGDAFNPKTLGSQEVLVEQKVTRGSKLKLIRQAVVDLISLVRRDKNVTSLVISGKNSEAKSDSIDLFGQTLKTVIKITNQSQHSDLQLLERKDEIVMAYRKIAEKIVPLEAI